MEIAVSFLSFSLVVCVQAILHRLLLARGIRSAKTFLVYPLGFVGVLLFFVSVEATVLYALLSAVAFIFFITPVLGDTAPTSRIMLFLRDHPRAALRSIVHLFRDEEMVEKRLDDVVRVGLVEKKSKVYRTTAAGRFVAWSITRYLALISWEPSV